MEGTIHPGPLADVENRLVHRRAPEPSGGVGSFHCERLYDGGGEAGAPFVMGRSAAGGSAVPYQAEEICVYDPVRSPLGRALVGTGPGR